MARLRPQVHTQKHLVQLPIATITAGVRSAQILATAVLAGAKTTDSDVEVGSQISAVYIELWIASTTVTGQFTMVLEKTVSGATAITAAEMATLNDYDNKKNILYTTQGLTSDGDGAGPVPIVRQWFKIPKGKQRFGQGDGLALNLLASGVALQRCGFATYKEQF